MKPHSALFCVIILFCSCSSKPVIEKLSDAARLEIYFTREGTTELSRVTSDPTAIRSLAQFLGEGKEVDKVSCAFAAGGTLRFYGKDSVINEVHFTDPGSNCRYFSYEWDQQRTMAEQTREVSDFLISLREGKNHY